MVIKMRWYFSSKLQLYVDLDPLKLDKRVLDACRALDVAFDYDTEKNICNIDFDDSRRLLEGLGGRMLTLTQYWELYEEAVGNTELLESLTSDYFTEPLDRVYISANEFIDEPRILSKYEYDKGKVGTHEEKECRPGWFLPDGNIEMRTGLPINVNKQKSAKIAEWKFWTADLSVTKLDACFVLRGYVTSVGRPSLDLGIPVDSKQPKQMVRECRKKPLTTDIDAGYLERVDAFLFGSIGEGPDAESELEGLISDKEWRHFLQNIDNEIEIRKEMLIDRAGIRNCKNDCGKDDGFKIITYNDFLDYLRQIKSALARNIDNRVTFVIGHRNPDSDTVVSSILEAYRNTLLYPQSIYIPIIQSTTLPAEIGELIGDSLSGCLIFHDDAVYLEALDKELHSFIFVDHNYQHDAQKSVCKIIDHHEVSNIAKLQRIPKTLEMTGSTTALVMTKFLGLYYSFDKELLEIVYGAMLMDTENKVEHKMTIYDHRMFAYIEKRISIDAALLYKKLSNRLISETDIATLFRRDYKDFDNYGFAVIKTKDRSIVQDIPAILELARANNVEKAYPLTLVKIVIYNREIDVQREIILFERDAIIPEQLVDDVKKVIRKSLELSFEKAEFSDDGNSLAFFNIGKQLSRKRISSAIEKVVREYDGFVYVKSIGKWVGRDFLKADAHIKTKFGGIRYDPEGYINYCSYPEAKELLKYLGYEMLTLPEYWKALKEMKETGDVRLEKSLKHSKYIEFLGTTSKEPRDIPEGSPSLFFEGEVDESTGLPNNLLAPNHYGLPDTWRYWSNPDNDNTYVFTRSHIFLLDTPCLDAKTLEHESFPNLLIRPVSAKPPNPKIDVKINGIEKTLNIFRNDRFSDNCELIYEGSSFTE
jgi:inorganic pyrophosphatase/exopolyphosphatase